MRTSALAFKRVNPMPPPPAVNVYRIKLGGIVEGQLTMNTFYYTDLQPIGTAVAADLADMREAFIGAGGVTVPYTAAVSADWSFTSLIVDSPTSPNLTPSTISPLAPGTGPVGHEPNQVAVTIVKQTDWRGQHGRGRISLPAVPTIWVTGTRLSDTVAIGALATKMRAVLTGLSQDYSPGLLSRTATKPYTLGWQLLSNVVVRQILGSCRRRKPGVGK